MNRKHLKSALLMSLLASAAIFPEVAMAATWGDRFLSMNGEAQKFIPFLGSIFFIIGLVLVGVGLFKFKAWKDNPQQTPLSQTFVWLAVGIGLMFLPSFVNTTAETGLGTGAATQGSDGYGMSQIKGVNGF